MPLPERLLYLFHKRAAHLLSDREQQELAQLISEADPIEINPLLQQLWENIPSSEAVFSPAQSETMYERIRHEITPVRKISRSQWYRYAAVLAGLTAGSWLLYQQLHTGPAVAKIVKINRPKHDALPGTNKAILTLGDGRTIALNDAANGTLARQQSAEVTKLGDGRLAYHAGGQTQAAVINTVTTPNGGQYQLQLADGTQVWLNANSSLKFPAAFNGRERIVELTGEAYFEVHKDARHPFTVKTATEQIRVLGTHFNVMAYQDEQVQKTSLLEGKVAVSSGNQVAMLAPGQEAMHSTDGRLKVEAADVEESIAWKNGFFKFTDADVPALMRQIARWYDVKVEYQGQLPARQFNGTVPRNVKLSEMLSMLSFTGLRFRIDEGILTVTQVNHK